MRIFNKIIEVQTKSELDFIDITETVKKFVKESEIKNGFINIQSLHTTAAVVVNENEPLLIEDFKKHLEQVASTNSNYQHNDFTIRTVNLCPEECANGHAHCRALHLPISIILNLLEGEIQLGQWQRIFIVELDRSRKRKIQVQIIGE